MKYLLIVAMCAIAGCATVAEDNEMYQMGYKRGRYDGRQAAWRERAEQIFEPVAEPIQLKGEP